MGVSDIFLVYLNAKIQTVRGETESVVDNSFVTLLKNSLVKLIIYIRPQ